MLAVNVTTSSHRSCEIARGSKFLYSGRLTLVRIGAPPIVFLFLLGSLLCIFFFFTKFARARVVLWMLPALPAPRAGALASPTPPPPVLPWLKLGQEQTRYYEARDSHQWAFKTNSIAGPK